MGEAIVLDGREWSQSFTVSLKKMQESGLLCDTAIVCSNEDEGSLHPILAHACVLAASSPSLKDILVKKEVDADTGIKHLEGMGFGDVIWRYLLEFMYKSKAVIPADQKHYLKEIEDAALSLGIKGLIDAVTLVQTKDVICKDSPENDSDNESVAVKEEESQKLESEEQSCKADTVSKSQPKNTVITEKTTQKSPRKRKFVDFIDITETASSGRPVRARKKKRRLGEENSDSDSDYKPGYSVAKKLVEEHVCDICDGKFPARRPLQQHMKQFHPERRNIMCRKCNIPFNCRAFLEDHNRKVHSAKMLECKVCYKEFLTKDAWKRHNHLYHWQDGVDGSVSLESVSQLVNVPVDTLLKSLPDGGGKEVHVIEFEQQESKENTEGGVAEEETTEEGINSAPASAITTVDEEEATAGVEENSMPSLEEEPPPDEAAYDTNQEEEQENEKVNFACSDCSKSFVSFQGLTKHQQLRHPDKYRGSHECSVCKRAFGDRGQLEDHQRIKHDAELLVCTLCPKKFRTRDSLYRHERFKHYFVGRRILKKNRRFQCEQCEKAFKMQSELEDHMREEHNAPPLICETCGTEFTSKNSLYRHNRYQHGESGKDTWDQILSSSLTEEEKKIQEEAKQWKSVHAKFKCDQCDYAAMSRGILQEHMKKHSDVKHYKCEHCGKDFKYRVGLLNHQARHHPEVAASSYTCEKCPAIFGRKVHLEDHCRKKHGAPRLVCEVCNKTYRTYDAMYRHKRYQHPAKMKRRIKALLKCECGYSTLNKSAYDNHQLTHSNVRAFICDQCGVSFKYKAELVKHRNLTHEPDYVPKTFECDVCGFICKDKPQLKRHYISKHQKEFSRTFSCDVCKKEFGSKTNRNDHIRFDHSGQKITCQFCPQTFSNTDLWYDHKQSEHPDLASKVSFSEEIYACGVCDKTFTKIPLLRRHERYHITNRPFKCDECNCTFTAKEDLKTHMKIHSGEKPFSCHLCDFVTLRKPTLTAHLRKHDESQKFTCLYCSKSYVVANSLKKHLKSAHQLSDEEVRELVESRNMMLKMEQELVAPSSSQEYQTTEQVYITTEDGHKLINLQGVSGEMLHGVTTVIQEENGTTLFVQGDQVQHIVEGAGAVQEEVKMEDAAEQADGTMHIIHSNLSTDEQLHIQVQQEAQEQQQEPLHIQIQQEQPEQQEGFQIIQQSAQDEQVHVQQQAEENQIFIQNEHEQGEENQIFIQNEHQQVEGNQIFIQNEEQQTEEGQIHLQIQGGDVQKQQQVVQVFDQNAVETVAVPDVGNTLIVQQPAQTIVQEYQETQEQQQVEQAQEGEVLYVMADDDEEMQNSGGELVRGVDENGQEVVYVKMADGQYVEVLNPSVVQ